MTRMRNRAVERKRAARRGISLVEVIVVILIVGMFLMIAMFALPRQRESARMNDCRRNLMMIGRALALYDDSASSLPTVPRLDDPAAKDAESPLKALLTSLDLPDLTALNDSPKRKKRAPLRFPPPDADEWQAFIARAIPTC